MSVTYYAITNFWDLQDKNVGAFDVIHSTTARDAYTRKDIAEALDEQGTDPDMSEYTYYPVITEQQAKDIEKRFGVKLKRTTVKARPDVSSRLHELTQTSPHTEM